MMALQDLLVVFMNGLAGLLMALRDGLLALFGPWVG